LASYETNTDTPDRKYENVKDSQSTSRSHEEIIVYDTNPQVLENASKEGAI